MGCGEHLFDLFMAPLEAVALKKRRQALMPRARGRVLEIGAGTGANLRYYSWTQIDELHLLDLVIGDRVQFLGHGRGEKVHCHHGDVERLPFPDQAFDTVVFTLVFCSVRNPTQGLAEVRRVLKTTGELVLIEHVRPDGHRMGKITDALNSLWYGMTGDCRINRDTREAIREAGFDVGGLRGGGHGFLIDGVATATP